MASEQFYDNCCTILMPFSRLTGLPIDQVNFLCCQIFAFLFGFPFRKSLGSHRLSPWHRHVIEILIGLFLAVFCFGSQVIHLAVQAYVCLALMYFLPANLVGTVVSVFAMFYLCMCHLNRMSSDYGGYSLDITGPLMISTQRLTSLAFNLADGRVKDDSKLSASCKALAVKSIPSILEFSSYTFSFHMLLCGPFCFYKDFIAFIDGSDLKGKDNSIASGSAEVITLPDTSLSLVSKCTQCVACGIIFTILLPMFPISFMTGQEFREYGFFRKNVYMIVCTTLMRFKYYFAWKLSEAVNVSAGLGFNGYDNLGRPKWDLIDNAGIYHIEVGSSLKIVLDNWNRMSSLWLRCIVYERLHNTLAVFIVSAVWHGFYAGYYLTFLTGGCFIYVGRLLRRYLRPAFQKTSSTRLLYDVITFCATRVSLAYFVFPFVLLEFWTAIDVLKQMYFWLHILGALIALVLTVSPPSVAIMDRQKQS